MKSPLRKILLEGLRIPVFIGVPQEERQKAQTIIINLICVIEMRSDFLDELPEAVDYAVVMRCVQSVCAERPRVLLETLANDIAGAVFNLNIRIQQCTLTIRKPKKFPELEALGIELDVRRRDRRTGRLGARRKFQKSRLKPR